MKLSILSAIALSASVIAAPLMAEDVKPVQPTVATQGETAAALGALTQAELAALALFGTAIVIGGLGGSSSPSTSTPSTIALQ